MRYAALLLLVAAALAQEDDPALHANVPHAVAIATASEPGQRMLIKGQIFDRDGKTPLKGVVLYIYHTDNKGVYNDVDGSSDRPRLKAWATTDEQGRFEFSTIKPTSYPNSRNPAHVHVIAFNGGKRVALECWFAGDPYLTDRMKEQASSAGDFSPIIELKNVNGILHGKWKIKLQNSL